MKSVEKHISKSNSANYYPKKDRSLLFLTIAVGGFFVGFLFIVGCYYTTLIDIYNISKIMVGFAIIGFLIPLKYYQKWLHFIKYEMIIFNVIGVAPFLTGLFLVLNFMFASNFTTTTHKIEKFFFDEGQLIGVVLEENAYSEELKIVGFRDVHPNEIARKKHLKVTLAKGLFGFDVIKERALIN